MRHRKKTNHLSRKNAHRKAMLANMASSLILHKRITTTTAKAKELRTFVEPIITRSKEDSTHSRRMVFKHLRDKYAVSELFREVATRVGERPGGYTRIIKLGNRQGDNADMCIIELVDYNENLLAERAAAAKPKSTRRRRGGKKKEGAAAGAAVATAELEQAAADTGAPEAEDTEQAVVEAEIQEDGVAEAQEEPEVGEEEKDKEEDKDKEEGKEKKKEE